MGGTETLQTPATTRDDHTDVLFASLTREAFRLQRPLFCIAATSFASALIFWALGFGTYIFDSLKWFLFCGLVLLGALTPGALFVWLRAVLAEAKFLPQDYLDDLDLDAEEPSQAPPTAPEAGKSESTSFAARMLVRAMRLFGTVGKRLDAVFKVWDAVRICKRDLLEVGALQRVVSFLAHPASGWLVGLAFVITGLLVLGAISAAVFRVFAAIF